jgi:hypothetical protein
MDTERPANEHEAFLCDWFTTRLSNFAYKQCYLAEVMYRIHEAGLKKAIMAINLDDSGDMTVHVLWDREFTEEESSRLTSKLNYFRANPTKRGHYSILSLNEYTVRFRADVRVFVRELAGDNKTWT